MAVAWLGFGLAAWHNERLPVPTKILWAGAILFRVALWATEPTLSDDVYRYLWDGHVFTSGFNPYHYTVNAAELDAISIPLRGLVNNPTLGTPYLPATQILFALVAIVAPADALSMQVLMTGFDLTSGLLIVWLLGALGLPRHRAMLYLWNPLVIVEVAHGAHLDAFMVVLGLGALATVGTGRMSRPNEPGRSRRILGPFWHRSDPAFWIWSPLLLAAATLTRAIPALLIVVLWWRWRAAQRALFIGATVLPVMLFALGAGLGLGGPSTGTGVFGSARVYAERWEFNSLSFDVVRRLLDALGSSDPGASARQVLGLVMLVVVGGLWVSVGRRSRGRLTLDTGDVAVMAFVVGAYVVLTTTFHPWYLLLLLALIPLVAPTPSADVGSWMLVGAVMYLAAASSLSYLTYLDPSAHAELAWVRWIEWVPAIALGLLGLRLNRTRSWPDPTRAANVGSSRLAADGEAAVGPPPLPR